MEIIAELCLKDGHRSDVRLSLCVEMHDVFIVFNADPLANVKFTLLGIQQYYKCLDI